MNNVIHFKHIGLLILFTLTTNISLAGGSGTGGGVSVKCTVDFSNGFDKEGFYLLDYIQASKEQRNLWAVLPNKSRSTDFERIKSHLRFVKDILSELGTIPDWQLDSIKDYPEKTMDPQLWYPWDVKLIESEPVKGVIPKNCKSAGDQIVTFRDKHYWYWDQGLANLKMNGINQYAALYTHEMLRMLGMDTEQVLKWTPVFHDLKFLKLKGTLKIDYLRDHELITQMEADIAKARKELLSLNNREISDKINPMIKTLSKLYDEAHQISIGYNENTSVEQQPLMAKALLANQVPKIRAMSYRIYIYLDAFRSLSLKYGRIKDIGLHWGTPHGESYVLYSHMVSWTSNLNACASLGSQKCFWIQSI
jgi:hypothetical protein